MSYMELIRLANVCALNTMATWAKALHIIHGGQNSNTLHWRHSGNLVLSSEGLTTVKQLEKKGILTATCLQVPVT